MSIQEMTKKDNLSQDAESKIEMEKLYYKLEKLSTQLEIAKDEKFQDWMMTHISRPLLEAVSSHLKETDTNKSFTGKGVIKIYQKLMGWTQLVSKEISELKDEINKKEAAIVNEDTPNNTRPEN